MNRYRPEFWPTDEFGGPVGVLDMALELHMNFTGASDCLSDKDRYIKCLQHCIQNWRHFGEGRAFDMMVYNLIIEALLECKSLPDDLSRAYPYSQGFSNREEHMRQDDMPAKVAVTERGVFSRMTDKNLEKELNLMSEGLCAAETRYRKGLYEYYLDMKPRPCLDGLATARSLIEVYRDMVGLIKTEQVYRTLEGEIAKP